MSVECWWNDTVKVKPKGLKRNVLKCHFIHIKSYADWTGMECSCLLFVPRQITSHRSVALLKREAPNKVVSGLSALQCFILKTFLSCFAVTVLLCVAISRQIWTEVTRAVRNVSSHSEYLENRSHGLDVTWRPVE